MNLSYSLFDDANIEEEGGFEFNDPELEYSLYWLENDWVRNRRVAWLSKKSTVWSNNKKVSWWNSSS